MSENPWAQIPPDVCVEYAYLTEECGYTDLAARRIVLAKGMTQRERRSTLLHELIHLRRGDEGYGVEHLDRCQERAVEDETARRLIPLDALAEALAWTSDEWEVADVLWVDVALALHRIKHLTAAETAYIEARIEAKGEVA